MGCFCCPAPTSPDTCKHALQSALLPAWLTINVLSSPACPPPQLSGPISPSSERLRHGWQPVRLSEEEKAAQIELDGARLQARSQKGYRTVIRSFAFALWPSLLGSMRAAGLVRHALLGGAQRWHT